MWLPLASRNLAAKLLMKQAITPAETDYTAPLSAVAAKKPEALYYGGYVQEAVVLVNQMAQSGLDGVHLLRLRRHLWCRLHHTRRQER